MRSLAALAAGGLLLGALAGCATPGSALDVCEEQLDADVATAADASATTWEGGRLDGEDRVYRYTATLTLGDVDVSLTCQVASTPDGFLLQDYDADSAG